MGGYDDYEPLGHELAEIADNASADADLVELARAAERDRAALGNPPKFCPGSWPESFTNIHAHLGESSAAYAFSQALKLLKGIDVETIRNAAYQLELTFDWIESADETIVDGPQGLHYVPVREVLDGPLQYMEYCLNELTVSDAVDGELGTNADDAMLWAILSVSLFVRAAQIHFAEALSEKCGAPIPREPAYSDIIGTACYAACEAKNYRWFRETIEQRARQDELNKATESQERVKALNDARHDADRKAKALVLKWWEEGDYAKYSAKSDAAAQYPAALEAEESLKGCKPFKPSSVTRWLREARAAEGKVR